MSTPERKPESLKITTADINGARLRLAELQASATELEPWQLELTADERRAISQQNTKPRLIQRLKDVIEELGTQKGATPETRGRRKDALRDLRREMVLEADRKHIDAIEYLEQRDQRGVLVLPSWRHDVKTWKAASVHPKYHARVQKELSALRKSERKPVQ
jgi:hypothetical protein